MRFSFGLRAKILVFSSFLFAIPYLGYQYVWELETYLRIGQEQTLVGTARSVATALHERPALFASESALLQAVRPGKDLYAHKINQPIQLDGRLGEWSPYQTKILSYDAQNIVLQNATHTPESLQFTHMVGQFGRYLYVMFAVIDDAVVYRDENMLSIHRNDFLQIAMRDEFGQFQRYIIAPYGPGWVNAYQLSAGTASATSLTERYQPERLERRIQGYWRNSPTGYQIELRFPLAMLQGNIAFALNDVDDNVSRELRYSMGTANPEVFDDLGTVIVPSPEIEQIVQGLAYADARVWIVDKHQRVLARSGELQKVKGERNTKIQSGPQSGQKPGSKSGLQSTENSASDANSIAQSQVPAWWQAIQEHVLLPLYYLVLTKPPEEYIDDLKDAVELEGQEVLTALQGEPNTQWRLSGDSKAVILTAAHPIFVADEVMGAVVVEQTTHNIRTLRNQALEKQFNFFLAVIVLGTLALFVLASRISFRIRKLRDATDKAIDKSGKITGSITVQSSQDEIGDLSRGFAQVLNRLGQYNQYLEKMASRLSHELRTPVAVVKSSLENLELLPDKNTEQGQVFIQRAQDGLGRLSHILQSMSEATRLEHVLEKSEKTQVDLVKLLQSYTQSYVLPNNLSLSVKIIPSAYPVAGSPELLAQMLDKIMANAVDFAEAGSDIELVLDGAGRLSITNRGPAIPEHMREELFSSMVSIRPELADDDNFSAYDSHSNAQQSKDVQAKDEKAKNSQSTDNKPTNNPPKDNQLHLGLGLFMAKMIAEYHEASITIANADGGVMVQIQFT
jgi:two-component system sensor histidine kinase ChvG